jgi:hypothetical protein
MPLLVGGLLDHHIYTSPNHTLVLCTTDVSIYYNLSVYIPLYPVIYTTVKEAMPIILFIIKSILRYHNPMSVAFYYSLWSLLQGCSNTHCYYWPIVILWIKLLQDPYTQVFFLVPPTFPRAAAAAAQKQWQQQQQAEGAILWCVACVQYQCWQLECALGSKVDTDVAISSSANWWGPWLFDVGGDRSSACWNLQYNKAKSM